MKANARYDRACLAGRPTEHSAVLLKQILEERELGRVFGPCKAPPQWGRRTVPVPQELATSRDHECPLLQPPSPAVALAFPVVTLSDADVLKVRGARTGAVAATKLRRRSWTSRITIVYGGPLRDDSGVPCPCGGRGPRGVGARSRGRLYTYCQCPLSDPSSAFLVLPTAAGPMLFCHAVLLFGALGAVWGYGRLSDLLVHLARSLLAIPALHYVDDFGGVECSASAPSALSAFKDVNTYLGYVMKKTEAAAGSSPGSAGRSP